MNPKASVKRGVLYGVIGAIAVAAVCGIWAIVSGTFGWVEARILLTCGLVASVSVLALGGAAACEARRWHPIGVAALVAVAIAAAMSLLMIWTTDAFGETYFKATALAGLVAIGLSHVSMLALARLRRTHELARIVTVVMIAALVAVLSWLILSDGAGAEGGLVQIVGVLAIVVGAGSITVPILHRVAGVHDDQRREEIATAAREVSLNCPRCGRAQRVALGRSKCAGCGLAITVEIEEEHCPKCGYMTYGLPGNVCPECGTALAGSA
jgi:predicted RNA-binding Zn-ribbon protein involved in translation (DUF1610 family)